MTADEDGMADEYERPNKSLLKREAEDMKRLGDELVRMAPADLAQIPLPENLRDAACICQACVAKQNELKS